MKMSSLPNHRSSAATAWYRKSFKTQIGTRRMSLYSLFN